MKPGKFFDSANPPVAIFIAALVLAGTALATEAKENVLHTFRGSDGLAPYGRVISDAAGNLYGTTALGGASGAGAVFELTNPEAPNGWTETILYNFSGGADGSQPYGGLIFDAAGNAYGTTFRGGVSNEGVVYELSPPAENGGVWTQTVLWSFAGGADGSAPQGDLIFDAAGNLYGTTTAGGSPGDGIVFELTPPAEKGGAWTETVLHRFLSSEATSPRAAVIFDENGALYGTLADGGTFSEGGVFQLKPPTTKGGAWTEQTIYAFSGGADGGGPLCTLIPFRGALYGTTVIGGASGVGSVFKLSPPGSHHGGWNLTTLHSFVCGSDGCFPWAGLTVDQKGNFYGTTQFGGLPANGGTVFELRLQNGAWTEGVLFSFVLSDNQLSASGLLLDEKGGALYGTTIGSGMHAGMVFKLAP